VFARWLQSTLHCTRRLQRSTDREDEAGRVSGKHGARQVLRAVVRALKRGQLAGYAGDVWFPQPPPKDHPWRNDALSPNDAAHVGDIIIAQARYAAGTREILECWFEDRPIRDEYLIVDSGKLAGTGGAFLQRRLHTTPVMTSRSDKPMPARMGRSCVRTQTIMGATETTMCCNSRFLL